MHTRKLLLALLIVLVFIGVTSGFFFLLKGDAVAPVVQNITSFEECAKVNPVMESYPPRCTTKEGVQFTQDIGNELSKLDLITIDSPRPNTEIASPINIEGRARGMWYFEASFPIELQSADGTVIAIAPAQAQSEWMTENFVPYKLTLTFPAQPAGSKGKLVLRKDNPSGLPEHDDSLVVPITFK